MTRIRNAAAAWLMRLAARLAHEPECKVCGCSEYDPCWDGWAACHWVAPDLCSGCRDAAS